MLLRKQLKKILIGLILLNSLPLFSQSIEVMGGLNRNTFFDFKEEGHFTSSYTPDLGYAIMIGIEDLKFEKRLRFTLSYEEYGGSLVARNGGLGSGSITRAEISKSILSLGIFPLNFKILRKIDLSFGLEFSGLLKENIDGTLSGWSMGDPIGYKYDLSDKYDRYSAKTYFGLRGRIAYDFNISDKLILSPQYSYYFGITKEFEEFPEATRSMRHFLGVGLQRRNFK